MSIGETIPATNCIARASIAEDVEAFLAAGKSITEIPRGQSAHNLQIRAVSSRGRGTRVAWVDPGMSMKSKEAKRLSVKQVEERKARKEMHIIEGESPAARRERLMPKILELIGQGNSRREVAAILGMTRGTINKWLRHGRG